VQKPYTSADFIALRAAAAAAGTASSHNKEKAFALRFGSDAKPVFCGRKHIRSDMQRPPSHQLMWFVSHCQI